MTNRLILINWESPLSFLETLNRSDFEFSVFQKIFFELQDSCLAHCNFLQGKTQFLGQFLVIIVVLVIFDVHLSDRVKYFVRQNEILLVLTFRED